MIRSNDRRAHPSRRRAEGAEGFPLPACTGEQWVSAYTDLAPATIEREKPEDPVTCKGGQSVGYQAKVV